MELARRKKGKLLELAATGKISDDDFAEMSRICGEEIRSAEAELEELCAQRESGEKFRAHMETIRRVLREAERECEKDAITKEFVDTFIDRIYAAPMDGEMQLTVKIFTGDECEKYVQRLKSRAGAESRTGHTFKKMVEKYENEIKNSAK